MADDKRLDTLQEEIKLMKGELKQSLASVRDYLLNMELPTSEISDILSELSENEQKVTMRGNLGTPPAEEKPPEDELTETEEQQATEDEETPEGDDLLDLEEPEEPTEEAEEEAETTPEDTLTEEEEEPETEDTLTAPDDEIFGEPEDAVEPEPEISAEEEQPVQEEQPMPYENTADEASLSVPKVNMLANLINWVARANKEIGRDQLPTFLEVYGISGHLTPELKEVILQLADITASEPDIASDTEIWSQAMLLLHGILTGGDAPLHPAQPAWNNQDNAEKTPVEEEIIEVDKSKDKTLKLKLVLPDEDGEDKEFCINLTPEAENSRGK